MALITLNDKMAAAMASSHKRRNVCTNRPLYRDGRRERAVKVFTINQESRYLLVYGVPDINITDELLKLLSLYGVIEEYRTVDDDATAEEFTKTHWIKYADIQAARVAKRKMDDHSFYGGFLHVTYAPESESIQDTREKLQQRRMGVARRLRKLVQERAPDVEDDIDTVNATSSTQAYDRHLDNPTPITAWGSNPPSQQIHSVCPDPLLLTEEGGFDESSKHSTAEHSKPDQGTSRIPPSLPEPPRRLPPWQWNIPSQPEFPRLRTKHDTLPAGYNPFPDRGGQHHQDGMGNPHQRPPPVPALPTGAFIGPARLPGGESINPALTSDAPGPLPPGLRFSESGARPKDRFASSEHTSGYHEPFEQRTNNPQNGRNVDRQSAQTDACQRLGPPGGNVLAKSDPGHSQGEQRPKLVGKRRIGPNPTGSSDKQTYGRHSSTQHISIIPSQHPFLPRPVSTRAKRSASNVEEDDQQMESGHLSSPATGDISFDQTVSGVRQQMFQVSQAAQSGTAPISVIQSAIIQARNQERMGLLPRRPPTKRQRI